ncbi:MAG: hypothetical protein SGBAC_004740 [Bacillariaceae sp.]
MEETVVTPETQPQPIAPKESQVPISSLPPATTQDGPSNPEKLVDEPISGVVANSSAPTLPQATEADSTGSSLPANPITAEAETHSKESTNQPADSRSANAGTVNSKSSSQDYSSNSILRDDDDDDFISSHGNNAIVERSPGERYVRFMEKLGSGASKEVYRAYDTQEGIEVAWNVVHLAGVPRNERNRIVNEVQLLERLHHHNIISFHGSWVNRAEQQVNFVTEILSSGTLKSFITKVQVIRWKIAKRWAVQILKGLEYLHSQDPPVIHRDLKCENVFINGTSGDLRIGDLGLSTVHRNGKQLSVLGTPEFMAPDMYEENSYDEKVDVYSFGMCMLEIFTKEIPYRECNNPAQIYKKVSRGVPPNSLKRIQSTHARAFVELCLGQADENGKYNRPSATELLAHPFLQKRPSDDDEVEVLPLMQERVIGEYSSTSSPSVKAAAARDRSSPASSSSHANETLHGASSSSRQMQHSRSNSLNDDGSDKFDEMPDSEVNMRKVKVLVGRGMELQEEDDHVADPAPEKEAAAVDTAVQNGPTESTQAPAPNPAPAPPTQHYLVAAAVIENDTNARPYQDDILKLVVTLPVEGQTQNVQFDFHLVQDDAIQVAKEMVAELGIPQGAVLEISETISGLARAARVSQDKYFARQKAQGHLSSTQMTSVSSLPAMPTSSEMSQQVAQAQSQGMVPSTSHHSMHEQKQQQQVIPNHPQTSHTPQSMQPQGIHVQEQSVPMGHSQHAPMPPVPIQSQHLHMQPAEMTKHNTETSSQSFGQQSIQGSSQQPQSQVNPMNANQQVESHIHHHTGVPPALAAPSGDTNASQPTYGQPIPVPSQMGVRQTSGVSTQSDAPAPVAYPQSQQAPIPSQPASQATGHHAPGSHVMQQQQSGSVVAPQSGFVQAPPAQSSHVPQQGNQVQGYANGVSGETPTQHPQHAPLQPAPMLQQPPVPVQQAQTAPPTQQFVPAAGPPGSVERTVPSTLPQASLSTQDGFASISHPMVPETTSAVPLTHHMNGTHQLPVMERLNASSESDQIDEELAVELRKLDEEFKKTVSRAKKVFDSRMDNMARLQHQREAQHLKTLSEHEKQRNEFEKRLQQEEIEQNKRIEQLQKNWVKKRQEMKLLELQAANDDASNQIPISSAPESHSEER